jgi:RNA polymerase sigma-70 factor (ECF subfamily)
MANAVHVKEFTSVEIQRGLEQRNPQLIGRLIDAYGGRLFRYLLLLTGNHHLAEDFIQETWVRVLERGYQYRGDYSFQGWLFGIARHLVIDMSRQKKPLSLDDLLEGDMSPEAITAGGPSPLEMLCDMEQANILGTEVQSLPARHREVFELRLGEELKLSEIAETKGIPLSTVKSRLYRAAEVLHARLAPSQKAPSALGVLEPSSL